VIDMENTTLDSVIGKKALIVDDYAQVIYDAKKIGDERFDCPELMWNMDLPRLQDVDDRLRIIDGLLRNTAYAVIIMDGDLELRLVKGSNNDGNVLVERLRCGDYGSLNQQTPILNSSSTYTINGAEGRFNKDSMKFAMQEVIDKYLS
jgi:hypothetical protein